MLSDCRIAACIPVQQLDRARPFYENKLGLKVLEDREDGVVYEGAGGTELLVFPSSGVASGTHTQVSFECDDVDAEVAELRSRGVTFEQYDLPGFKTDANGVAEIEGVRGAWFKDPEGNLLALGQRTN